MADAATWSKRVTDWRSSGMTAGEFCAERGLARSSLYWWSAIIRRKPEVQPVALARLVRVPADRESKAEPPLSEARTVPRVVIEVAGVRVFVSEGVQRTTLDCV